MDERMYEVSEVARMLRLSEATIRAWIAQGKIRAVRLGSRTIRIHASEVERLVAEGVTFCDDSSAKRPT